MALFNVTNGGLVPFRSLLSDVFDREGFLDDKIWNRNWVPSVNVSETDKTYEIDVAAPGMRKDDFKVRVEKGTLTVSAERKEEKEEKKKNYTRQEYSYNSFSRSFTMPEDAKEEDIKAQYQDGELKLSIAKKAVTVSKVKEIEVQ